MEYIEVIKRPKTPIEKVINVIINIICWVVIFVAACVCVATLKCKTNNVITSIGGYSAVTIAPTGSMVNSGFNTGDVVLVKKCNVRALKGDQLDEHGNVVVRGDIIAYYKYFNSSIQNECNSMEVYTSSQANNESLNVSLTLSQFFGEQNNTINAAGKLQCSMIFHHVKEIRQDENGKLYFRTYGSSNTNAYGDIVADGYWISEDVIVGRYYENGSPIILSVFKVFSSSLGIIVLVSIPILVFMFMIFLDVMKYLQLATMEEDVLKGKLSLTDPVCVANHIGIRMNHTNKFKVLAQLSPQERIEAVSYLWQSPKDIQYMKKYFIKQKLLMHFDEQKSELKMEYADKLRDAKGRKIATVEAEYHKKLRDIERQEAITIRKLKSIAKKADKDRQSQEYADIDSKILLKNANVKLKTGETIHIGPHKSAEAKKIVEEIEHSSVLTKVQTVDASAAKPEIDEQ